MNYLDTSALIKRFVAEKGSPLVQTLVKRKGPIATAKIAYAEVYAGLTRKLREGHLSDAQYALACRLARDLIRRHPLKGFDAIHLASAISLKNALGEDITFAAADERLLRAAKAEDLKILHVEIARTP